MAKQYDIGFIGAGQMAQALASGLKDKYKMIASDVTGEVSQKMEKTGLAKAARNNLEVVTNSSTVIFAVKPHIMPTVLHEIASSVDDSQLFISVVAGLTNATMETALCKTFRCRVIRVMPNTPSLVRCGVTVYSPGINATEADCKITEEIFSRVGICERLGENLLDAVTGLSGSGPAFMYIALEAMSDAGVKQGLPRDMATKLAAQTMMGAAKMVQETGRHPGYLKDQVTSPGGTTIQGVAELEAGGFRSCIIKAIEAAVNRARELGKSMLH